jgi:acyl-CoA reductase-like NAD-dependent aldehyde dehydrogenase
LLKMATGRRVVVKTPKPTPISGEALVAVVAHAQSNPLPVAALEKPGQRNPVVSPATAAVVATVLDQLRMLLVVAVAQVDLAMQEMVL